MNNLIAQQRISSCPFQLSRMFRSLSLRSLLLPALREHTAVVWQSSGKISLFNLDCDDKPHVEAELPNREPTTISPQDPQTPLLSTSEKARSVSDSGKFAVKDTSDPDPQPMVIHHRRSVSTDTFLHAWKSPDFFHVSDVSRFRFTSRNFCHTCYRPHFTRSFSCSSPAQTLNHFHTQPRASSVSLQQRRAVRQTSPRVVVDWRDCLSLDNEMRCRQSLRHNLKQYDKCTGSKESESQRTKSQRCASILISLCSVEGQPAFLFTLRSTALDRNKGDVSFAGGKCDLSDRDVVATALRETREELGIDVAAENIWGVMKPLSQKGMMIAPVLANLGSVEELSFNPNPAEVEEVFTLPFSHLCDPQNCGYTHFRTGDKYGYTLPVFHSGKHRVWGLTAVAVYYTLKLVVPPELLSFWNPLGYAD